MNFKRIPLTALALTLPLAGANAQLIFLRSDASTQAAATTNLTALDTGNTAGLTFRPALIGNYGTYTPVPYGAPAGTVVVNLPGSTWWDGPSGFFKVTFTLPVLGPNVLLTGRANADDFGRAFLNGQPLTPSLTSGQWGTITEFGDAAFWTTSLNAFRQGYNELLISDYNTGGPSGAAFYAIIYPAGLIQWTGGPGYWTNVIQWSPALPSTDASVLLPDGSVVIVNVADAQTGGLTVDPSATITVQNGGTVTVTGPSVNNGTVDVGNGGQLAGCIGVGGGGVGIVQNGTLNIGAGGQVCLGCGTGGGGVGVINLRDGTLQVGNGGQVCVGAGCGTGGVGIINVQGGALSVDAGGQVLAGGSNGGGYGLTQSGGSTLVNGSLNLGGGAQMQDGSFTIGAGGTVAASIGVGGGGVGFNQSGGSTVVNGTLASTIGIGGGGVGLDDGTLSGSGMIAGNLAANGGVLSPGSSPGTLTVSNDFALNGGGTLLIELAGTGPGQFDQLKVGGGAGLAGGLIARVLPGFAPAIGDQFEILTTAALSGEFSRLEVPPGITVTYTPTSAVLVVTSAVPAQILEPTLSGGDLVFSFATVTNQSYTVEYNDDLATTNWQFYTNLLGSGALMQVEALVADAPCRFFRVRQP